jgi:hypothetical protein
VKQRRIKKLGLCAIFKGVSVTIGIDSLAEVTQSMGTEPPNGWNAIDEKLWDELWRKLEGILSTVKKFKLEEDKVL